MSKISLKHSGGNVVSLNSPTSAPTSSDVAFKLPNADGSAGQFMKTDGSGNLAFATVAAGVDGITMADSWNVTSSYDTTGTNTIDSNWARTTSISGTGVIGSAMTQSSGVFTFPSTGIYYIRYQIATYITTGASRYISARLYFNGATICMPWSSSSHISGNQTTQSSGSQAILDVTNTSHTFKIQMQSQNPVVVVGNNEAGYSGTATMSDVVVIRLGDT